MTESFSRQIQLFMSVFKGRDDVFAIRWEKENKSGYMPAYAYDPYLFRSHKMKGGTFQTYNDKTYLKLSEREIVKHLEGIQQIGIYPLLPDNTTYFLVADFDKMNWINDARKFLSICIKKNIPAYLERSRSGQGGHVWIFFDQPYPAFRSRKVFLSLLEQSGAFSVFDKSSSFDRLFPNQDFLSGKGLGNLIALPLFKNTLEQGNSCFIDPISEQAFGDQFDFLSGIKKISISALEQLFLSLNMKAVPIIHNATKRQLNIILNNKVHISRDGLTTPLINYLKEELNFVSSEFIIRKKSGKNTYGTERHFKFVEETENEIIVPKGVIGKLIRFCRINNIEHIFIDQRLKQKNIPFLFNALLRPYQLVVLDAISKKELGVIVAPPGSGKTIVALKIIADKQQSALIIVHRKQLVEQWIERIETFLGIPAHEIGKIGHGKSKIGNKITVATIQSLSKEIERTEAEVRNATFGTIIVDECHHIPAETFRSTIGYLSSFYLYGLTATPFRKYNDGKLIFIHLGEIISEIRSNEISKANQAQIIIRNTGLDIPFNSKTDQFETLSNILIHDSARNQLIITDVLKELKADKRIVIITERKDHIDSLQQLLKLKCEIISLSGADSEINKKAKWKILIEGNYQVLITTGQYFGEGSDLQNVNCLFLVYPFSFEGKLIQYIGRVQRSEVTPTIYDYRDIKIDYLNKLFLKRNSFYRKIEKQASLFDEPIEEVVETNIIKIERQIKVSIEQLSFHYGSIVFVYHLSELKTDIEFSIDNPAIRPEFEVLKPYFIKILKSKNVNISIYAEFENGTLVSQLATSEDIAKINHTLIDGLKFSFVLKNIFGKQPKTLINLLDINQIQEEKYNSLYNTGEELLEDLLKKGNFKHQNHLHFLAQKHTRSILKLRFVLSPFSFVFLLTGKSQYHVVLETLDTEEATYLWHIPKDKEALKINLKEIEKQLGLIRLKGRQVFLSNQPENFSRILHDYSDEKKGFIAWKDSLIERIV